MSQRLNRYRSPLFLWILIFLLRHSDSRPAAHVSPPLPDSWRHKTFDTEPTAAHTAALLVQEAQNVWIYHRRTGCLLTGSHSRLRNELAWNFDIDSVLSLCELNRCQKFRGIEEAMPKSPLRSSMTSTCGRRLSKRNPVTTAIQPCHTSTWSYRPVSLELHDLLLNHPATTMIQPRCYSIDKWKHNQSACLGLSKPPELQPALWLLARLPCHPQEQTVPANFPRAPQPQEGKLLVNDIHNWSPGPCNRILVNHAATASAEKTYKICKLSHEAVQHLEQWGCWREHGETPLPRPLCCSSCCKAWHLGWGVRSAPCGTDLWSTMRIECFRFWPRDRKRNATLCLFAASPLAKHLRAKTGRKLAGHEQRRGPQRKGKMATHCCL